MTATVRVILPFHLQTLAGCAPEVKVEVDGSVSVLSTVRALEQKYPTLRGAIIDLYTGERRPKVRFFACAEDVSLLPLNSELPQEIGLGKEPLMVVGAISGG